MPDIGRIGLPVEKVTRRHLQGVPVAVALECLAVNGAEHFRTNAAVDGLLHLLLAWPEVAQVDWLALFT